MPRAIGDCVDGRYEIEGVLGEGGFGETYKARDVSNAQLVVLKVPHMSVIGDLWAYNRFLREIEIGQRLNHPGIQRVLSQALVNTRGGPYMVLEYVDGESLRTYLPTHRPLPVDEVVRIGSALATTLQYVHEQGIIHRDLKPDNVLMATDGSLKLADFGIAQRVNSHRLNFNHLANTIGTPGYMAPEQVRGEAGDNRTDVYALGVVLYELLTGCVPYAVSDVPERTRRYVSTEPPLVRCARPDASPQLEAVIYRALRRNPRERYQSMAELSHDLGHLETVTIPEYQPDIPPPRPAGDLPPWRTSVPIFLVVFGLLVMIGLVAQFAHRAIPHASP